MKKSKIIALVLCVLMVVGALVLASCSGCPGEGNCTIKKVSYTVTSNGSTHTEYDVLTRSCESAADHSGDADAMDTAFNCAVNKAWNNTRYETNYGSVPTTTPECDC